MRRTRNKPAALGVCAGALLLSLAAPLRAADIRSLEVTRDGDAYRVVSTTFIAASPDSVYAVLADYDDYERISSIFQEARYVEPLEEGKGRVFTRVLGCILFFCQSVDRLEDITVADQRQNTVENVPDGSASNFFRKSSINFDRFSAPCRCAADEYSRHAGKR